MQHCGLHLDLRGPGKVVALQRAGQPGEVLEAADLGRHVLVIAAVLGHLHHTVLYCTVQYCTVLRHNTCTFPSYDHLTSPYLDLPLVGGAVPHGDAHGGRVRVRGAEVEVSWHKRQCDIILISAANRLIGEFVQSQRRPLLGPSPG